MARQERPITGAASPLIDFANALRRLRREAGNPGYRELARRAHYSPTTLSEAAAGRRLPTLDVTVAYVRACDGDVAEWEARWRAVADWLATTMDPEPPDTGQAPYLGLAAFQPEDADRFVGREHLLDTLVARLAERRLIAVVGPSGSGKSSLLRAGLVARLMSEAPGCAPVLFTPGADPLGEWAVRLAGRVGVSAVTVKADLAGDPRAVRLLLRQVLDGAGGDLVLVVDQFEEVFTLCGDAEERARFIAALLAAVDEPGARTRVVLGVRADFLARCAQSPELAMALREGVVLVGPMNADEVRRAIIRPASDVECTVEGALVATLVAESAAHAGALPLLSHVLLEVWRRRRGNALTLAAYESVGGMAGALERTAEAIYAGLDERQRQRTRALFLRLIAPGEGTEDTKRRMPRHEINLDDAELAEVVARFVRARLLLLTEDGVEISHEALIHGWPRLLGWLAEDRDLLRAHRRLTEAATEWDRHGRDDGLLYRGARLLDWHGRDTDGLNELEQRFLAAGRGLEARERARSRRRVRLVLVSLIAVLSVVSVLAGVALVQGRQAAQERDLALSRQLALQARAQLEPDPTQALRLARQAYQVRPTAEAEAVLRQAVVDHRARIVIDNRERRTLGVAFSPDGAWLAYTDEDGEVRVWPWSGDRVTGTRPTVLPGHDGEAWSPVFSPDGRRLATSGIDGTIRVSEIRGGGQIVLRGHEKEVWTVAFSPDGRRLASASSDGTVRIWDLAGTAEPMVLRGHEGAAVGVVFSPDGRHVASSGHDHTVRLWDLHNPGAAEVLRGHEDATKGLAFSPDGLRLVSASVDGTARVWTLGGSAPVVLRGHQGTVEGVAFSPDGTRVATTGDDNTVRVWNPATGGDPLALRGHTDTVWSVAFNSDGTRLVSVSSDATVRVWDPRGTGEPVVFRGHTGPVWTAAFTPDGGQVVSGGADGAVRVWNATSGAVERILDGHDDDVLGLTVSADGRQVASASRDGTVRVRDLDGGGPVRVLSGHEGPVWTAAFSPDGHHVASAGFDGTLRIWDTRTGTALVRTADTTQIRYAAFSPDGRSVATGGWDGTVRVWDTTGAAPPRILRGYRGVVWSVAFSPDGRHLVSSGNDGTVRLWDLTDAGPPQVWRGHEAAVWHLSFSPDGRSVVTTGKDGTVRVWPISTAGEPVTFSGFGASVESVAFSPDGHRLVTTHDDGTVRVWRCDACGPVEQVIHLANQLASPR
jgi:WD40 repeat protein/energy-coupling factor transporter ATP-binding protein EcfA2